MTEEEFKLDVAYMSEAAEKCKSLSATMSGMKSTLESYEVNMVNSWTGDGSSAFKKKFHKIIRQFKDLRDELETIADNILTAQEAYIQTDMDFAKTMDGVQTLGTAQAQKNSEK